MHLIDTNVFLEYLHDVNPGASFVERALEKNKAFFSVLVVGEVYSKYTPEELEKTELILKQIGALDVDLLVARRAGTYRKEFLEKGKKLKMIDCLLAATAFLQKLTLVTYNLSDFPMKDIKVMSPKKLAKKRKRTK